MAERHRTYCRNCQAACGLVLEIEENRVTAVEPDRDHPLSAGYMCVKGLRSADWQNGEDRLLTPQKRRADGGFDSIDADRALDEIAAKLSDILERDGPRAIALYYGTGVKLNTLGSMTLRSWLRAVGSPYLYSSSTIDQSAKWVTMGRLGVFTAGKHVIHEVDAMLCVGANPAVSHVGLPVAPVPSNRVHDWMREAKKRGAKLVVIDPRKTEFARHADLHLQVLPGEDVSLLAAILNVIFAEGWEDKQFCARFATSVDALRAAVRAFTPHYAAQRAQVDAGDIVEAARIYATAPRKSAWSGTGPDMAARSNLAEHLVEVINVVCGAYRRAGDIVRNTGAFSPRAHCAEGVVPPNRTWESEPKLWTEDTGLVGGEYPTSRIPNEITRGGLKALIVIGGNLATALGQPEKTLPALQSLDLLVSIDPRMTETAQLSHYVLPTTLPYERHDATHFFDAFFVQTFAQVAAPIVSPPEGMLHDWEVFWGLSRRMGLKLTLAEYKWGGGGSTDEVQIDMQRKPDSETLIRALCARGAIPFEEHVAHPEGLAPECAPLIVEPAGADDGARLDVCPSDVEAELHAVRAERPEERFRYRLAVRRMLETMNSAFRNASATRRRWPHNPAFMNPDDMRRDGIASGDCVEIASEEGAILAYAQADRTIRPSVVSMSHQWGAIDPADDPGGRAGGFTGRLVSLDRHLEGINYMPRQSGVPVNVRRLEKAE